MRIWQWQALLGAALVVSSGASWASSPVTPQTEYYKKIRDSEMLAPLTSELFGDSVSLSTGATEFVVTDINLPGNDALPVKLQRRLAIQSFKDRQPLGGFGSWDIDVPYMHATFDSIWKWNESGNGANQRCSQSFYAKTRSGIASWEIWNGTKVHVPGQGEQEVLLIANATNPKPTNGDTYRWGTRGNMRFSCLASTANGYPGEGFLGVDATGNRYFFNVAVERSAGNMSMGMGVGTKLVKVLLMASRVEDRQGNWVAYDYSGDRLVGVRGSDGRSISIAYDGGRIASATANGRTWRYEYNERSGGLGFSFWPSLRAVVQPDGARLTYEYSWQDGDLGGLNPEYQIWDGEPKICVKPHFEQSNFTLIANHPAGTRGQFDFSYLRRSRTGIRNNACADVGGGRYVQRTSSSYDLFAVTRKTLSGPGLGTLVWQYDGGGYESGIPDSRVITVVEPDGTRRHSVFGRKIDENEGQLLQEAVRAPDGQIVQVTTNTYVGAGEAPSMPFPESYGTLSGADDPFAVKIRPLKQSVLSQDGVNFINTTDQFDANVRPVVQTESNSLGRSRTLRTTYFDDTGRWILGQVARSTQTVGGVEIETERTDFDALTRPQRTYAFGVLQQTLGYHPDGTLASVADGKGNAIALGSWKRGLPQSVAFPDGSSASLQVDDNGWVRAAVEPNGASRSFDYDGMGRIVQATQAANDSVAWNPSTTRFFQVAGAEIGLEAGHWKRESSTGNARAVTYYDGLWRPVLEESFDAADRGGTLRQTVTRYDSNGRPIFTSYPTRAASDFRSALPGTYTGYDALGRPVRSEQDSELGRLITTTEQLGGGSVRVTNPRGIATTTDYLMYGKPAQDRPIRILHAEGVVTEIQRDTLGKPLSILRRNGDGSISVRRQYVYDGAQRLCKSMEPETGATGMGYDAAGNLLWSASGLTLLGAQCESEGAYASPSRADRGYDSMNRLVTLRFSDGRGDQDWSYWPGGKVRRVQTRNNGASTINEYSYNLRGLPTSESVVHDGSEVWALGYGYDANGALATHVQPSGLTIGYSPNALGQPTRAGTYATNVRYYANGGMSGFTYGNGVTHQMTQNARGLPDRSTDSGAGGKVIDDGYDYDANGNVAAISDGLPAAPGNRDMRYDGLDRLTAVTASSFGNASYAYNVLDNIVAASVGARRQAFEYDFNNRLTNVRDVASGATVTGLGYDAQGNLKVRNGVAFRFDYGNRLREVDGKEAYQYDAHGRRTLASAPNGNIRSFYGQDGVLRYQHDQRQAKGFDYIQLNGSLVAKRAVDIAPAALVVTVPGYSGNGAFAVQWAAVAGAQRYEVQESRTGTWQAVYQGTALTVSLTGRGSGTYRYRGRACNGTVCGAWGVEASIQVELAPTAAPVITAPAQGINGTYSLSWSAVQGAARFVLEEAVGAGWNVLLDGPGRTYPVTGKAAGAYRYRVKACNPQGCGAYSAEATVTALYAPSVPTLSVPAASYNGSFVLSLSSVAQASSYRIEEQFNGGAWTEINRISGNQLAVSGRIAGRYVYRAFACNDAGCSAASATGAIVVTLPPVQATGINLGGTSYSSTVSMSWGAIPAATSYQLVEQLNGGGFGFAQENGATSVARSGRWPGQWDYQVRGCNIAGCGPWSAAAGVRVIGPPATPVLRVPDGVGIGAAYSISLLEVADATRYEIDESTDGANWSLIAGDRTASLTKGGGGNFYYRGRACNPAGCSASSAAGLVAISSAPPVPTGVKILKSGPNICSVIWNASPGATYYNMRSSSGGATYRAEGIGYDLDTRCQGGYKVRACNAQACSAWSN
ncbi:RHS repeat protein [Stenotrophomonas maltophilia]|uniref:RHS repeat protein n=1 Tax=Stenotrophomonas maltophilia TaxID=40324 RepID=UPI0010763703|nr:RHS repeat protein [Stenotrophomonas maltophilia]TFZ46691.1 RHS repeat protein [Stenotrophomonas maltophilia]